MKLSLKVMGDIVYSMEIQNAPLELLLKNYKAIKHQEFETLIDKVLVPAAEHAMMEDGRPSTRQNVELSQVTQLLRMADTIYQNSIEDISLEVQA